MSRIRRLFLLAVLALAVTSASGAFTTTAADRGLGVEVVEDERMVLGIDARAPELSNGTHEVVLLELVNQFPGDTTLTTVRVTVTEADPSAPPDVLVESVATPDSLAPGESGSVTVDVECPTNVTTTEVVTATVTVAGADERVSATRQTTVTCTE